MSEDTPLWRRRDVLTAAGISLSALLMETAEAQTPPLPGLIVREKRPENLEFPFGSLSSLVTPNDRFYVRSHFAVPQMDRNSWRLVVEGAVKERLELTYEELVKMTPRTLPATLECAGNSRVFLSPTANGVQWQLGAVSNAEWTGVPLQAVLQRAGVLPGAVEVILEGADTGEIKNPPKPAGMIHYSRSLPLERANRPEVLLAYRMNGQELPLSHGFPVRAIVPGWYGMASVKWLTRLIVVDKPYHGHFQTIDYAIWETTHGVKSRIPVTEIQVKAEIARPEMQESIAAGSTYRISGAAWTGDSEIAKVEVSTDEGKTWEVARLLGASARYAWRLWEYSWKVPTQSGRYTLMARATDAKGNTQPMERQPDRENYMINHVLPIEVNVR
ncbi:MAG: sulfite oxidase [Armatimonas sp.]